MSIIWGSLTFLVMVIITKVFVWDIMNFIRITLAGVFGETGGMASTIFLILQYLLTTVLVFIIPIAVARGTEGQQI